MNDFFNFLYRAFGDESHGIFKMFKQIIDDYGDSLLGDGLPDVAWTTIALSFVIAFAFYIFPINHPRFKAWWAWLIMLVLNAASSIVIALVFINNRLSTINESDTEGLKDTVLDMLNKNELTFTFAEKWPFIETNIIVGILCFIVMSLVLNWFSTNCRFSPFRK